MELLRAWVAAPDAEAPALLDRLFSDFIRHWCSETARRALRNYGLRGSDQSDEAAEVAAEVMLQIATRLQSLRAGEAEPIASLRAYAVTSVYNACFARIRARCPRHVQLQNRIRYLLRNDDRFALWTSPDGDQLAGLRPFAGTSLYVAPPVLQRSAEPLPETIHTLLTTAQSPVLLTDLIAAAAESLDITDSPSAPSDPSNHPSTDPAADRVMLGREALQSLWNEVLQLPAPQRMALLLNLRDAAGNGVIELIPATGIASFALLAETLDLSADALAAIWADLPLDDTRIAGMLRLTRQQVINLRKSARERLSRRHGNKPAASSSGINMGASLGQKIRHVWGAARP